MNCYLCKNKKLQKIISIHKKPSVEVDYGISIEDYHREIHQCQNCGTYNNFHDLIKDDFYEGFYNKSITKEKFQHRFKKIINLPESVSDNKKRVKRIIRFLQKNILTENNYNVLDVGSGTCVFLHEMKKYNIITNCIDPDPIAIGHAKEIVKVNNSHCGNIFNFYSTNKFDLISFNKVLEHVKNPIDQINESLKYLNNDGVLYIELPEGDRIYNDNLISERSEFAVEHYTVHNISSIKMIAKICDLKIRDLNVVTDPSGKYTIYAFLNKIL